MTVSKSPTVQTRMRLGELLVRAGVISDAQLAAALEEQRRWGGKLGDTLVRMRVLSEDLFVRALSKQLGLLRADLSRPIALEALARIPARLAEEYEVVPLALTDAGRTLIVATADPLNFTALDAIRAVAQARVQPQVAAASEIRAALLRLYKGQSFEAEDDSDGELLLVDNLNNTIEPATRPLPPPPASRPDPAPAPVPTPSVDPAEGVAQRREAQALRALVELLVSKGVISLDEYLARLKPRA